MLSPEQVATILDGEGTITSVVQPNGLPYPRVSLGMTSPEYPEALCEQFGGSVNWRKHKNPGHKPLRRWELCGWACKYVLEYCVRDLKVKKPQAEGILIMCSTQQARGGNRAYEKLSERDFLLRWKLHEVIRELNKRGQRNSVDSTIARMEVENTHA